jgi:hypothetical protein
VQKAINDLDDGQLRGMLYVVLLARGGDARKMKELIGNMNSAPLN